MGIHGAAGSRSKVVAAVLVLGAIGSTASMTASADAPFAANPWGARQPATAAVPGSWTVLHYSMADTDLEPFMMADINEMGEVGSNENLNIVAMIDRSADYGEDPVLDLGDWVGAKVVHIQQGVGEELADLGDLDMGDPATFASFISEGVAAFPAEHYAVIISDHGAAWPGVGPDESSDYSVLDLLELQQGLTDGLAGAGLERLDMLGFDACLMAAYEVGSALAPYADRLIASSELEPGSGWDYRSLQLLADDPAATVDDLGVAIVDSFILDNAPDTTLALLDLTQMPLLDEAMAAFSSALVERSATVAPDVGRVLAVNPGYGRNPDPSQDSYMTDLGTLTATIGIEALDVSAQADDVLRALNDLVVHKGAGAAAQSFSGLSIYFPPTIDLYNQAYVYAAPNPSGWVDFLETYYTAGQGIDAGAVPAFIDSEPVVTGDAEGITAEAAIDPASIENLSSATISYGLPSEDGSVAFFGDEPATISDDGSGIVSGFYDLTILNISDGTDTATAYISLSTDDESDGFGLEVPMAYYAPGWVEGDPIQDVVLNIAVDGEGLVVDETYYAIDPESGATGELYAEPDGIIVPRLMNVDPAGEISWIPTTDVGLFADLPNLQYSFEPLEPGTTIVVALDVTDFGGNFASISTLVDVP
jgi:hypothetical protein